MSVVDASFDHPLALEEHATMPLAGGIEQMGYQCGQLWGAALAAGAQAYRLFGPGPQAEAAAIIAAQACIRSFRTNYKAIDCFQVIGLDWKNAQTRQIVSFLLRGGPIRCFTMTAGYARAARSAIDAAYTEDRLEALSEALVAPVSCAALLAQKIGAPELHRVMAAGLAGGIGLSGGACGALGAAIWLIEIRRARDGADQVVYNSPEATEAIERFLESTDYEFECAKIAGRTFVDVHDHARYLRDGGCAAVIAALAGAETR